MTIIQLEYLLAVANCGSFSLAAEHCFVTQPSLSMQIKSLEEELGVVLLDRSKKPVIATEAGEVVLERARETLRAYVYKATVQALPGRAVLVMCAAGAGMLGTVLCMIVHGTAGRLAGLLLCLLLKAALLAVAWLLRRYVQTLTWEGPPKETAD